MLPRGDLEETAAALTCYLRDDSPGTGGMEGLPHATGLEDSLLLGNLDSATKGTETRFRKHSGGFKMERDAVDKVKVLMARILTWPQSASSLHVDSI